MIMDVIAWIVFGAIVGWIASLIMNTDEEQGLTSNIIVGIIGAFIGGLIMQLFGMPMFGSEMNGFNLASLMVSILGAIVLLFILRAFGKGRAVHH